MRRLRGLIEEIVWDEEAQQTLDVLVKSYPVLTRISAAKRLRDAAEAKARASGVGKVTSSAVLAVQSATQDGWAA